MDDDDRQLATLLGAHAERMTDGLTDASVAYPAVARRALARRGRRTAVVGGLAAAAALAGVFAVAAVTGERATVRTPATTPTVPVTTVAPTVPTTMSPGTTVAPTTFPGTTVAPTTVPETHPAVPPTPTAVTYDGIGGSITVQLTGDTLALVGDPSPASGYTTRVDDNGPDRVRVRFEGAGSRTEIRVDVEGGQLVPEIIED